MASWKLTPRRIADSINRPLAGARWIDSHARGVAHAVKQMRRPHPRGVYEIADSVDQINSSGSSGLSAGQTPLKTSKSDNSQNFAVCRSANVVFEAERVCNPERIVDSVTNNINGCRRHSLAVFSHANSIHGTFPCQHQNPATTRSTSIPARTFILSASCCMNSKAAKTRAPAAAVSHGA